MPRHGRVREESDMRYLTMALTKGRLAKQTMQLLEKVGISCEEMTDPATRKLIFINEELKLKFFLAKGPDVPTYVKYGSTKSLIWASGNAGCALPARKRRPRC